MALEMASCRPRPAVALRASRPATLPPVWLIALLRTRLDIDAMWSMHRSSIRVLGPSRRQGRRAGIIRRCRGLRWVLPFEVADTAAVVGVC
jgi:hypothetical protein